MTMNLKLKFLNGIYNSICNRISCFNRFHTANTREMTNVEERITRVI